MWDNLIISYIFKNICTSDYSTEIFSPILINFHCLKAMVKECETCKVDKGNINKKYVIICQVFNSVTIPIFCLR